MKVVSLSRQVTGDLKPVLLTIRAATGFVLLFGCVNLAILLLARATTRHREMAVRVAPGPAGPGWCANCWPRASSCRCWAGRSASSSRISARPIAITVVLLVGAGLSAKSFINLLRVEPRLAPRGVVTVDIFLPSSRYRESAQSVNLFRQAVERIEALPGVESVGMNYALPFGGINPSNAFEIEGRPAEPGAFQSANLGLVNADHFRALGIPLLRGRAFNEHDTPDSEPVAIIDERMAKQFFPGEEPPGKRVSIASKQLLKVVGVVGTVKHEAFESRPRPYVYLPYQQRNYTFTSLAICAGTAARGQREHDFARRSAPRILE